MEDRQHRDGYPWTWEPAAATLAALAMGAVVAIQAGRATALWLTGQGWWWPSPDHLAASTWTILTKADTTAGLTTPGPAPAPTGLLWTTTGLAAALLAAAIVWAAIWIRAAAAGWGMASRAEAEQLLGASRLHRNRNIIRPDLHPNHHRHGRGRS